MTKPRRTIVALVIASLLAVGVHVAPTAAQAAVDFSEATLLVGTALMGDVAVQAIAPSLHGPTVGFWSWVSIIAGAVALFARIWCEGDDNENWGC